MKNIHEALSYVQKNLKAPKGQYNSFGKYKYRSCEDILEGLKQVLPDGAFVTLSDDIAIIGDRFYVSAIATFHFGDAKVTARGCAREALSKKGMDDSQLTGSCSSYARKYALNGLFAIDDTKDSDYTNQKSSPDTAPIAKPVVRDLAPMISAINAAYAAKEPNWDDANKVLSSLKGKEKNDVWVKLTEKVQEWVKANSKRSK